MIKACVISLALLGMLSACAGGGGEGLPPAPAEGRADVIRADAHEAAIAPADDAPAPQKVIQVFMLKMLMPYGQVCHNADFWKLVDEDAIDVGRDELLKKNGLRVGRGKVQEWAKYRDIVDQGSTACQTTRFATLSNQDLQLDMVPVVDHEMLWIFDEHGLTGRSFEESHNKFSFRFQWAPHKKDTIRIRICPVVVTVRNRIDYSLSDNPPAEARPDSQHLYDLGLCADIAPGEFLVVGLSPDADNDDRVGRRFLSIDGQTERFEQVLVLVGEPMEMTRARAPSTRPAGHP